LPSDVTAFLADTHIPVHRDAAIILGSPVGRDAAAIHKLGMDILTDCDRFFSRLLNDSMNIQIAMTLLRVSGVPRLNYLLRTLRPHHSIKLAATFDSMVEATALAKMGIKQAANGTKFTKCKKQMVLPTRLGGLGLCSQTKQAHIAWLSSYAASTQLLSSVLGRTTNVSYAVNPLSDPANCILQQVVSDTVATVRSQVVYSELMSDSDDKVALGMDHRDSVLSARSLTRKLSNTSVHVHALDMLPTPASGAGTLSFYSRMAVSHMQSTLSAATVINQYVSLTQQADNTLADHARLQSLRAPHAGA